MRLVRRLLALDDPEETRFWWFLSAFALVIGGLYVAVSQEPAGSVLLLGFALATGVMALVLSLQPVSRVVRTRAAAVDRPFLDEAGRLPDETTAPLAVGAGLALIALAAIFGPAPAIVGVLPLAWGGWMWLASARAELDAVDSSDQPAPAGAVEPQRAIRPRRRR